MGALYGLVKRSLRYTSSSGENLKLATSRADTGARYACFHSSRRVRQGSLPNKKYKSTSYGLRRARSVCFHFRGVQETRFHARRRPEAQFAINSIVDEVDLGLRPFPMNSGVSLMVSYPLPWQHDNRCVISRYYVCLPTQTHIITWRRP